MEKNQSFRLSGKEPHIVSLILLSAFAAMGAVLMTPALPDISNFFKINPGATQWTVTTFLLGYAIGQLIYGPVANRLGRKPAFYIGISIATLGSILSILSSPVESFHLLILGRFIEAIGASAGLVVCFTIINDFYFPDKGREVTALMLIAFAVVPGIAITVGGFLTEFHGWQSCFYFLLAYGLLLYYPALTLPETISKLDPHALRGRYLIKNYLKVSKDRNFIAYSLIFGFSTSFLYLFSAEGPFIGLRTLGLTPSVYGLYGLIPYIGAAIGFTFAFHSSRRWHARIILRAGLICETLAVVIMLTCFLIGYINLITLLAPTILLLFGHALIAPNVSSLALSESKDKSNGSAMMTFITMGIPVIMTFVLGAFHINSPLVLPILFSTALIMLLLIYMLVLKRDV